MSYMGICFSANLFCCSVMWCEMQTCFASGKTGWAAAEASPAEATGHHLDQGTSREGLSTRMLIFSFINSHNVAKDRALRNTHWSHCHFDGSHLTKNKFTHTHTKLLHSAMLKFSSLISSPLLHAPPPSPDGVLFLRDKPLPVQP